jgi:1,4-dihydroxy-2-naphthoate octaprenyltransferase
MKNWKLLLGPMRLPFIILAPACVLVGLGSAYLQTGQIDWFNFLLALVAGVLAHISVNAFNEYFDYKSEVDARTRRTPFSGGSGTLQAHPELAKSTLVLSWSTLAIVGLIGLYFCSVWGWWALPVGLLGLILLYGYTAWMVYQPLLCLIAPGLGFGPLLVLSTHFALTGTFTLQAFIASLVPFFLVSNLLLLNQFPDVEADRSVGRRHFPILLG